MDAHSSGNCQPNRREPHFYTQYRLRWDDGGVHCTVVAGTEKIVVSRYAGVMVGIFALAATVGSPATTASATSSGSTMAITTNVTTTLQNFEFNAYFGPAVAQVSCELDHNFGDPQSKGGVSICPQYLGHS